MSWKDEPSELNWILTRLRGGWSTLMQTVGFTPKIIKELYTLSSSMENSQYSQVEVKSSDLELGLWGSYFYNYLCSTLWGLCSQQNEPLQKENELFSSYKFTSKVHTLSLWVVVDSHSVGGYLRAISLQKWYKRYQSSTGRQSFARNGAKSDPLYKSMIRAW